MAKNKLKRFAEVETFENVLQPSHEDVWNKEFRLKANGTRSILKMITPLFWKLDVVKANTQ